MKVCLHLRERKNIKFLLQPVAKVNGAFPLLLPCLSSYTLLLLLSLLLLLNNILGFSYQTTNTLGVVCTLCWRRSDTVIQDGCYLKKSTLHAINYLFSSYYYHFATIPYQFNIIINIFFLLYTVLLSSIFLKKKKKTLKKWRKF